MAMTDKKFEEDLQLAAQIVKSWPAWKQTSLQVTAMAKTPKPRSQTSNIPASEYEQRRDDSSLTRV
jgi:hypothetical protein